MKFKVDENLPFEVGNLLEENGYDALTLLEQGLGGKPDSHIAEVCKKERRTLITLDTDFCDIRKYSPQDFYGLIVLRLKKQDKPYVLSVVNQLIKLLSKESLQGFLWIVEEGRVRISGGQDNG